MVWAALSGLDWGCGRRTQGDALGYLGMPRWGVDSGVEWGEVEIVAPVVRQLGVHGEPGDFQFVSPVVRQFGIGDMT